MSATPASLARVLVVGRSPGVLVDVVDRLRAKGHLADATNQFDDVLHDYDVSDLDVLVFGGMIPPDTKELLRQQISARNATVTFVQGLAGIAGVIVAQVEGAIADVADGLARVELDETARTVRLTLTVAAHVTVDALWGTSFRPPEPTSTSEQVFDGDLAAGGHQIAVPDFVPSVASFVTVTVGSQVQVLTVGPMPQAVERMVPKSAKDRRLPGVAAITTSTDDR